MEFGRDLGLHCAYSRHWEADVMQLKNVRRDLAGNHLCASGGSRVEALGWLLEARTSEVENQ